MKSSLEARQQKLKARRAAIDLSLQRLAALEKEQRRRDETRAKIILGGAILSFLRGNPIAALALQPRLLPFVNLRDREIVIGLLAVKNNDRDRLAHKS